MRFLRPNKKDRLVWKVYFKKEGCTMLLFKNLSYYAAYRRKEVLTNQYTDWCGHFIVTK